MVAAQALGYGRPTLRFAILMYADPAHTRALTPAQLEAIVARHAAFRRDATNALEAGEALAFPEETTVLRRAAPPTDGPLVAGGEQLTAWYVVECEDARAAEAIAARVLDDHVTAVEVRRIHDSIQPL
jgi:hypothetical protein